MRQQPLGMYAIAAAILVVAVRYTGRGGLRGEPVVHGPTPQQVLADRFARGDLDEEQYTRTLKVLDATAPARGSRG